MLNDQRATPQKVDRPVSANHSRTGKLRRRACRRALVGEADSPLHEGMRATDVDELSDGDRLIQAHKREEKAVGVDGAQHTERQKLLAHRANGR